MSNHKNQKHMIAKSVTVMINDVCTQTNFILLAKMEPRVKSEKKNYPDIVKNKPIKLLKICFFV